MKPMKPRVRVWVCKNWSGFECRFIKVYGYGKTIEEAYNSYLVAEAEWSQAYSSGEFGDGRGKIIPFRAIRMVYREDRHNDVQWPWEPADISRFFRWIKNIFK
jgi:hypothetical protein